MPMTNWNVFLIAGVVCVLCALIQIPFMLDGAMLNFAAFGWCAALAIFNFYRAWAES